MRKTGRIRMVLLFVALCCILGISGCATERLSEKKTRTVADKPLPDQDFRAGIRIENIARSLKAGSTSVIKVTVKNMSKTPWPAEGLSEGKNKIQLSYHWYTGKPSKLVVFDGLRTPLPYDLAPDQEVLLDALVKAPDQEGEYTLVLDMVQEQVKWFGWNLFREKSVATVSVE